MARRRRNHYDQTSEETESSKVFSFHDTSTNFKENAALRRMKRKSTWLFDKTKHYMTIYF